jgi:putative PIN family toxin of toxin-antitoxin system
MRPDLRCVIDTSTLISALLSNQGPPNKVLETVLSHGLLFASTATFQELETRIYRRKFDRYVSDDDRAAYLALLRGASHFIEITEYIEAGRDPRDDLFLELAVSAEADVLISSDKDLTDLRRFRGIPILKPVAFLESTFVKGEE